MRHKHGWKNLGKLWQRWESSRVGCIGGGGYRNEELHMGMATGVDDLLFSAVEENRQKVKAMPAKKYEVNGRTMKDRLSRLSSWAARLGGIPMVKIRSPTASTGIYFWTSGG